MSLKNFQIVSKLGEGAYSSVYIVKRLADGVQYALKKVRMGAFSQKQQQNALTEVRILASMKSQNIVSFKEAFYQSHYLCIVMEYMDNGDLFQKIEEHARNGTYFPEQQIWHMFGQIVKGLRALHKMKIMHRDLKSANVFLNKDGTAKLGDMNVSKVAKRGLCDTQTGTPYYASPEVWNDQPYDFKSDIWSLGCVLYQMIALKPPFRADDMEGLYRRVVKGTYSRIPSRYSSELSAVIRSMLQTDPRLRPTCDQLLKLEPLKSYTMTPEELKQDLLKTIRLPKMNKLCNSMLPSATYSISVQKTSRSKQLQSKMLNVSFPQIRDLKSNQMSKQRSISKKVRKYKQAKQNVVEDNIGKLKQRKKSQEQMGNNGNNRKHSEAPQDKKQFLPKINDKEKKLLRLQQIYLNS